MKLNNKGFAITAVLYGLLILFVLLVGSYLTVLLSKKNRVDKITEEIEKNDLFEPQPAASLVTNLFSKTGTVTEDPTGDAVELDVDTTHQLIKDKADNIRYYGTGITDTGGTYKEPNNYIDIGDRDSSDNPILWRIIGVFDGKLKLIRSAYIKDGNTFSNLSWDTSESGINDGFGINQWGESGSYEGADLMRLLNQKPDGTDYEGINGSLYWNSKSGTCYKGENNKTIDCNFTNSGLSENVKNKISTVTWNLAGWGSSEYPNDVLKNESGKNLDMESAAGVTKTLKWQGKVGLAYPSDYGYATDLQQCKQKLENYNNAGTNNTYPCRGNNWMWYTMTGAKTSISNGSNSAWFLSQALYNKSYVKYVNSDGKISGIRTSYSNMVVLPTFYLKSEIMITDGKGTKSRPYKIS